MRGVRRNYLSAKCIDVLVDWSSSEGGLGMGLSMNRLCNYCLPATIVGRSRMMKCRTSTSRREACAQGAVLIFASYNACFFMYILFYAHFLKQYPTNSSCAAVQSRTDYIGNCSTSGFDHHTSGGGDQVSWLGATWDEERVVGISFTFFNDPETREEGDYNPHRYSHAEIHFTRGETLADLVLKALGHRHHNSLRRIELSTSGRQVFIAGPDGIDDVVVVAATNGTILSGFYGLVNQNNFLQALGAWITGVPDACQHLNQVVSPVKGSESVPIDRRRPRENLWLRFGTKRSSLRNPRWRT